MAHMDLWNSLEKTDPQFTKPFTKAGGFRGTGLSGTYVAMRLTEAFGPCGRGWRFVVEDDRVEEGHTLANGDRAKVHIIRGHIAYMQDGTWYQTSSQFGQTMLVDQNRNGAFTDEEAPKKSVTDCVSKCAVLLGIGADIHLGKFDDNKYVNQRKAEEAGKKAGAAREAAPRTQPPAGSTPFDDDPLRISVPVGDLPPDEHGEIRQGSDWQAWGAAFKAAILAAETVGKVNAIAKANAAAMQTLERVDAAGAKILKDRCAQRRTTLSQAPGVAAE